MRLPRRGRSFCRITYHARVTQCLAGVQPGSWLLAVAAPSGSVENYPKKQVGRLAKTAVLRVHSEEHAGACSAPAAHWGGWNPFKC